MLQTKRKDAEAILQKAAKERQLLRIKTEKDTKLVELSVKILKEEF